MTPLPRFAALAVFALVLSGPAHAASVEELRVAKEKLEQELAKEQRDLENFRERRAEKEAQLEANQRTQEVRDQLAKEAEKADTNAMKDAVKDIPNALGGNDAKQTKDARGLINDLAKMGGADKKFNDINTALGDGTIDRERDALREGIKDLKNKEAIYGAFISGLNTAIANLDAAITKESAAQWAAFVDNLSKAVNAAQQRVNDRHAAEAKAAADKAEAERRAAEKANSERGGAHGNDHDHDHDHPTPSKPSPDKPTPDKPGVQGPAINKS